MKKPSYTSRRSLLNRIIRFGAGCGIAPLLISGPAGAELPIAAPEGLSAPENRRVTAVLDGNTMQLEGGAALRLAGIDAPKRSLAPNDPALAALENDATAALKRLVGSGWISLRYDVGRHDRYGRLLAQVFDASGLWLQSALIRDGQARVHGDGRNRLGLRALLQLEAEARDARRGLWRHWVFAVRAADDPRLGRFVGSFQIVAGRAFAAATVNGTGYVNFGADRHTDLTLVLKKPALDLGDPAMIDLAWLTAKPIRCRGWLDLHDGPSIDISHAEQIEVLEY